MNSPFPRGLAKPFTGSPQRHYGIRRADLGSSGLPASSRPEPNGPGGG
ncbi:hypothetical protein [Streptomyces murinus]